jgi:Protein of unknown function DUF262
MSNVSRETRSSPGLQEAEKQIIEQRKTIDYDTKEFTVELLVDKFTKEEFFVPLYQREFIWTLQRQSKFIESVLLGLPIPFMFMADTSDGRLEIVDGAQRMNTLRAFLNNCLSLEGLETLTLLNGCKFEALPLSQQRKFKNQTIRMVVLSDKTTEDAKFSIFERINTGSDVLKKSELRKGAYAGPFYSLVDELANNSEFVKLCPVTSKLAQRGERQELVLRYLAYSERYTEFKHDVANFLNNYIKEKNASFRANPALAKNERQAKHDAFIRMLAFVGHNFPYGFSKSSQATTTPRVRFEAIAVGAELALRANPNIIPSSFNWMKSKEFKAQTTTHGSNSAPRLRKRIEFVRDSILKKD